MKKVELEIVAISNSVTQSNNYAVVLGEKEGRRRLPIVIGNFEAQAIAVAMERMMTNRPMTHDLFKKTIQTFDIEVREVVINNLLDGVFHACLICERQGEVAEIDSRTSDALALAVRFKCPIYTYEFIIESAGVWESEEEESSVRAEPPGRTVEEPAPTLEEMSVSELDKALRDALAKEDYERAAEIRDQMNKRKGIES